MIAIAVPLGQAVVPLAATFAGTLQVALRLQLKANTWNGFGPPAHILDN